MICAWGIEYDGALNQILSRRNMCRHTVVDDKIKDVIFFGTIGYCLDHYL
jgi:hypothetical protein